MQLPPHYLSRPEADWGKATLTAFGHLFRQSIQDGNGAFVDYTLNAPKWQFLCYLADFQEVVLHGTGDPGIAEFEPRQSNDTSEFGNQRAVYAASDGIWATYFAIVDRDRYVRSLVNGCFRVIGPDGKTGLHYFFSINGDALPHNPWRTGTIYVLPRKSFEQQPLRRRADAGIESSQWRSFTAVKPLARLSVGPTDFPFLAQIRSHDPGVVRERALANPDGFPWLDT